VRGAFSVVSAANRVTEKLSARLPLQVSTDRITIDGKNFAVKDAADRAEQRILDRLKSMGAADPPVQFKFTLRDMRQQKVMVALMRRYGLKPYRYRGQRYTTVMARVPRRLVNETLWAELQEISVTLCIYLSEVTERVVSEVICRDNSEVDVVDEPRQALSVFDQAYSELAMLFVLAAASFAKVSRA
jgi:hypothetical protein